MLGLLQTISSSWRKNVQTVINAGGSGDRVCDDDFWVIL